MSISMVVWETERLVARPRIVLKMMDLLPKKEQRNSRIRKVLQIELLLTKASPPPALRLIISLPTSEGRRYSVSMVR